MNRNVSIIFIVVALIGLATFFIGGEEGDLGLGSSATPMSATAEQPASAAAASAQPSAQSTEPASEPVALVETTAEKDCKHPFDVFPSEDFEHERARIESMAAFGDGGPIESLVQLSFDDVRSFAEQGDSAAMVVLAKMHLLLASDVSPTRVGEYMTMNGLRTQQADWTIVSPKRKRTSEQRELLRKGRDWAWLAALHGRYMALRTVGEIEYVLGESAATKGWVTETFLNAQDWSVRHNDYSLQNVYLAAIRLIDPDAATGGQDFLLKLSFNTQATRDMAKYVADEFDLKLEELGLPRPVVETSRLGDIKTTLRSICDEYKHLL